MKTLEQFGRDKAITLITDDIQSIQIRCDLALKQANRLEELFAGAKAQAIREVIEFLRSPECLKTTCRTGSTFWAKEIQRKFLPALGDDSGSPNGI